MAMDEIAKRFTLHDLFGYLFPGTITLASVAVCSIVLQIDSNDQFRAIEQAFRKLHVVTQGVLSICFAYLLGLICVTLGDLALIIWIRFGRWRKATDDSEEIAAFTDNPSWGLDKGVIELFRERIHKETKCKKNFKNRAQISIAYAYLMDRNKQDFVEIMSGRQVTYMSLAGSGILTSLISIVLYVQQYFPEWWFLLLLIFPLLAIWGFCWARVFDKWWTQHVIYSFLLARETDDNKKTDDTK